MSKSIQSGNKTFHNGASEIRDESKALFGRVTQDTEVGASTLESCAKRIETILEAMK